MQAMKAKNKEQIQCGIKETSFIRHTAHEINDQTGGQSITPTF